MKDFVIKKNGEINEQLLDEILKFDRTIFPTDEEYSFPDDYFRTIYQNSKDGIFVLLNNNNVVRIC